MPSKRKAGVSRGGLQPIKRQTTSSNAWERYRPPRAKLAARKTQQGTTKDQQISLLEKQLADAQKTNQLLESMQVKNTEQPKKNKKKKRRKRRNKK